MTELLCTRGRRERYREGPKACEHLLFRAVQPSIAALPAHYQWDRVGILPLILVTVNFKCLGKSCMGRAHCRTCSEGVALSVCDRREIEACVPGH